MADLDDFEEGFEVDYYLLDDDSLGRVRYDVEAGEYVEGEVMDEDGQWHDYPAANILADGEAISYKEAVELARSLDSTI
ncbi:MAG TPA: hypothetical protein VM031_05865 [Phycisphaerae bacterium]|nr:hypothetical protein [Phycisphaerae bacterium]